MNDTETETEILSSLDFEPVCETIFLLYATMKPKPGSECKRKAEYVVKYHRPSDCGEGIKLMCKECMAAVAKEECPMCDLDGRIISVTPIK